MDFGIAFKKPFTDYKKLILGIALSIIPIVRWIAMGYILESSGVGKTKGGQNLPEWQDWGGMFAKGFFAFLVGLIYAIPGLILIAIVAGSLLISIFAGGDTGVLESLAAGDPMVLFSLIAGLGPLVFIAVLYFILVGYIMPSAILHYVKGNNFGDAFNFGNVFKKAFSGAYFLAWIVFVVTGIVAGSILQFIPIIGGAIAFFITNIIGYTLLGEAFNKA